MLKLHELRQQRNALATQMRSLHTDIGDESWSDEQRSKWGAMKDDLTKLDDQIAREEELRSLDQSFVDDNEDKHKEERNGGQEQSIEQRQAQAFDQFLRYGQAEMDAELRSVLREMRAQGVGTNAQGGFTVPREFQNRVIEAMRAYGGIANIANVLNTTHGRDMDWATSDGTSEEGELLGENSEASEGDVTYGSATLGSKKLSSKIILVSNELLQDSGISIEAHLSGRIATRIGRGGKQISGKRHRHWYPIAAERSGTLCYCGSHCRYCYQGDLERTEWPETFCRSSLSHECPLPV